MQQTWNNRQATNGHQPLPGRTMDLARRLSDLTYCKRDGLHDAIARLKALCPSPAEIVERLLDRDPRVRSGAAMALGRLEPGEYRPEVINSLRAAIHDPVPHVAEKSVATLGWLKAVEAREDILACLEDPVPSVVHAAVYALGRIGPEEATAGRIVPFLGDARPHLRGVAAEALAALGHRPAVPAILQTLRACLARFPRSAAEDNLGRSCIRALGVLQAKEVGLVLRDLILDPRGSGMKRVAVEALGRLGAEDAAPALAALLADPSPRLVAAVIRLMVQSDHRPVLPLIRPLLAHDSSWVRLEALRAVRSWGDAAATERVRSMCRSDPGAAVRPQAVRTLVALVGQAAIPDLLALAGDLNGLVRLAVAESLRQLGELPPEAARVLAALRRDLLGGGGGTGGTQAVPGMPAPAESS